MTDRVERWSRDPHSATRCEWGTWKPDGGQRTKRGTVLETRKTTNRESQVLDPAGPAGDPGTASAPQGALGALSATGVASMSTTDVGAHRAKSRSGRLQRWAWLLAIVLTLLVLRDLLAPGMSLPTPSVPSALTPYMLPLCLILLLVAVMVVPLLAAGRSPHILYRPDELTMTFDDVRGSEGLVEEVTKTLNLFLAYRTFNEQMGGTPRKAILFEGPPGTGKTYMAKAMAAEAGVPFLFVSSSAFQSMFYGQTNRKIRAYFKELRRQARREGGAIGFIEELDAIGGTRGIGSQPRRGHPRCGQRAAHPAPVVRADPVVHADAGQGHRGGQRAGCPTGGGCASRAVAPANILVIGATNRADDLDPALVRPGRFDRNIYFGLPGRSGRRDILDYYLGKKAHDAELDDPARRETLAAMTAGYSPVMIEHLLDEALVWALRRGPTSCRGTTSSRPR